MRPRRCILSALLLCLATGAFAAEARKLDIRPADSDAWKASSADVEAVLRSAAEAIWRHFPERSLEPIVVEPQGGPIVLFRRGSKGEYLVRLNTGGTYWCQYAYQFAHEFCHILCGYTEKEKANKWFEESLCEMASLFALRAMARGWRTDPPYPNWRSFSAALDDYADDLVAGGQLPPLTDLAEWYAAHEAELRARPCVREKNRVVAVALLPLFEKHPEHWPAVGALNAAAGDGPRSFERYLAGWHRAAPAKHRRFIRYLARQFEIVLGPGEGP